MGRLTTCDQEVLLRTESEGGNADLHQRARHVAVWLGSTERSSPWRACGTPRSPNQTNRDKTRQ